ncbi:MAG: glycerate kinase [Oscillatoriales cyanobacterium C42_A2020_001]|nr:glycerate kinase [Leptolyngbyaceae cyanobacterium C42_A2020_001]
MQNSPPTAVWDELEAWERQDSDRMAAFGIDPNHIQTVVRQRATVFQQVYPAFSQWCNAHLGHPDAHLSTLWSLWLPLAQQLVERRQAIARPWIQGILGGQGTGKTTLSKILTLILQELGYKALAWSLDDLYKTYRDRLQLQQQDPQLIWRGPPGTHDVELGIQVLDQLRQPIPNQPIFIPRFDKSLHNGIGDRIAPEPVENIDIVLFEGWFVGVRPIDATLAVSAKQRAFQHPLPPILTQRDRAFAQTCNTRLQAYLPLWQRLDSLWVLYPPDYRLSLEWRKQAEHQMKASGKPGMSDADITAFVEYFWKALHPQLFMPPALERADLTIQIQADHSLGRVCRESE